jgi:16S rRNA (cytidine1402-2'-O)-methyltransferase
MSAMSGALRLAATPIGRADDASPRLVASLASAPVIAAEDTRRLHRLARDLGVEPVGRIVSFFEGNERERVPELVAAMIAGQDVLLVTDAGMPSVSDPGYRLVDAALAAGVPVTVIPGPSAVLTALAISGLPVDRFTFEGFLPRKAGERSTLLEQLRHEQRTMVFFESPHRLAASLEALADTFGPDRRAAVCRELTKTYEEVIRDGLDALARWAAGTEVRGEITVVVEGAAAHPSTTLTASDLAAAVATYERAGLTRKDAITEVVKDTGARKRDVFDAVVATKSATPTE